MTYQNKNVSQEMKDQLTRLKPGQAFEVTVEGTNIGTYRNQIYGWLKDHNLKQFFRIAQEGRLTLRVRRLPQGNETFSVRETLETKAEKFALEHLIEIDSVEEAQAIIDQAIEKDLLQTSETIPVLEAWERITGGEAKAKEPKTISEVETASGTPLDFFK